MNAVGSEVTLGKSQQLMGLNPQTALGQHGKRR